MYKLSKKHVEYHLSCNLNWRIWFRVVCSAAMVLGLICLERWEFSGLLWGFSAEGKFGTEVEETCPKVVCWCAPLFFMITHPQSCVKHGKLAEGPPWQFR